MTYSTRARAFAELHQPGTPLVLYNIWDAGSAAAIAKNGARALATGSWSVAAAQGYIRLRSSPAGLRRCAQPMPITLSMPAQICS